MTKLARIALACLALAAATGADVRVEACQTDGRVAGDSFSKLRKIHLVRPDLIAYPLAIDFLC